MKEHASEEQLALYATEDLAADKQHIVAAHVETCAECRDMAAEFRATQRVLSDALNDPEAAELLEVRARVAGRLRSRRSGRRRWAWGLAGAAAVLAFVAVTLRFESRPAITPKPAPPVARLIRPEAHLETPHVRTTVLRPRHVHHREAGIRSVALITRPHQPALIKMATADPNVVILWQPNPTEDE